MSLSSQRAAGGGIAAGDTGSNGLPRATRKPGPASMEDGAALRDQSTAYDGMHERTRRSASSRVAPQDFV